MAVLLNENLAARQDNDNEDENERSKWRLQGEGGMGKKIHC